MTGLPLNIDIQQILLHFLNFVILAGGLYILLYKPVKDFMDKREAHYRQIDEAADELLNKAKASEAEYNEKLSKADEEIAQLKSKAMAEAMESSDKKIKEAEAEADKIRTTARINAEKEREQIIKDANEEVANLASQAAKKLALEETDIYASFTQAAASAED